MTFRSTALPHTLGLCLIACATFACGGADGEPAATGASTKSTQDVPLPMPAPDSKEDGVTSARSALTESAAAVAFGDGAQAPADPASPSSPEDPTTPEVPSTPTTPVTPTPDPSPKPTQACTVSKDGQGFFTRSSSLGSYVAYVPSSYDGSKPLPVVIGMHGCGDNAQNFATWGMAPYATRATQQYIGISVGSETGGNHCWSMGGDDAKVLAALDDVASCFWVDQKRVTIAGFSSGGQLAYRVGMEHADRFAGIVIEHASLYAAGDETALLAGAARKIPIAHRAASGDTVFPLSSVQADWTKIQAAGHPLDTSVVAGAHDGTSADWTDWLLPRAAAFVLP